MCAQEQLKIFWGSGFEIKIFSYIPRSSNTTKIYFSQYTEQIIDLVTT